MATNEHGSDTNIEPPPPEPLDPVPEVDEEQTPPAEVPTATAEPPPVDIPPVPVEAEIPPESDTPAPPVPPAPLDHKPGSKTSLEKTLTATTAGNVTAEVAPFKPDRMYIGELSEVFSFFDHDCDGKLGHDEVGRILRDRGFNPSDAEISRYMRDYDTNKDGQIDFQEFLIMLPNVKHTEDSFEEIYEAFRKFDKDKKGVLKANRLKSVLTAHGEKMSEEEAMEFIKFALNGSTEGDIDYRELTEVLLGADPGAEHA